LIDDRISLGGEAMIWGLAILLVCVTIVLAGRRHSRYLDELDRRREQVWRIDSTCDDLN
jgi:hypothetical protein